MSENLDVFSKRLEGVSIKLQRQVATNLHTTGGQNACRVFFLNKSLTIFSMIVLSSLLTFIHPPSQPRHPLQTSDYILKVEAFQTFGQRDCSSLE